ncbi:Gfo/Idh/MocA family protein [Maritalea porphyrae]|uniref:Gfo/Idh/MocA family protein n=1 Tax=Maritalea porphyrae TaxID=880732 RepID=UPI0022AFBB3B|nr:Gfo/Idh/MocA family oxidoreductase [Maritalea porphyrae]MCZ4271376.1 Gfo/Idh/MocA family oxidoreductase [Maritalea porphyrae]
MLRWGILGTAKIARERLVPAIHASNNGTLMGIASRTQQSADAFAQAHGIPLAFPTYEAMLASHAIDAVYIPLPTSQHVEWTKKVLAAGKHVLCEKPISLHASEVDQLIAARNKSGKVAAEAFMVTYHPQWIKVRDLLAEGAIGKLRHIQGSFTYFNRDPDNMRNKPELGGGGLLDIGVYPTVTSRFVTGQEPKRALATLERDPAFGTDIFANCQYQFDGFDMSFYCSTQLAARQSMIFHADQGFIEINAPFNAEIFDAVTVTLSNQAHNSAQSWSFNATQQYTLQVEAFGRKVAGDMVDLFTLENSKKNQAAIDALFASGESGDWESV